MQSACAKRSVSLYGSSPRYSSQPGAVHLLTPIASSIATALALAVHLLNPIASSIATARPLGRVSPHWLDSNARRLNSTFIMLRSFWETADPTFSHISYNNYLGSEDLLKSEWQREWLHHYNSTLGGATVVEYGIGGGLLGTHLFEDYGIARYIGIDISDRHVANARQRLAGYNARFERVDALDASIVSNETPTLVVSQAVIQHFSSVSYFQAFARQLSLIKAPRLMLQTRLGNTRDNQRVSSGRANNSQGDVQFALHLSTRTLLASLPAHRMVWNSTRPAYASSYAFYGLELV